MAPSDNPADELPEDADTQTSTAVDDADEETQEEEKLALDIKVEAPSACERHVTVTIVRADIDRYYAKQFDELMPKAEVPGFRPGRAPRKLVETKFRHQVSDQVKGSLLLDSMTQVNDDQDFSAISEPDFDFDAISIPDDGDLTFEFDIEVRPEFDMPDWKGLKVERPSHEFSDADIDRYLKRVLSQFADLVPIDGAAEEGDHVVCKIKVKHNGNLVSESDETPICIKENVSFPEASIDGFNKLMVGAKAGDLKTTSVKLGPDTDKEELREQEVEISFEVLDVKRQETPEITAELLQNFGNLENEDALRGAIKTELERQLEYQRHQRVRQQIGEMLTESADWELPPDMLRRQSHRELERAILELQSSGFSPAEVRAHENELRQNSMARTEQALKEHFILERIAEDQDIEDTPEDYDFEIAKIAYQQGDSPRRIRARLEKRGQMDTLRNQIVERKVLSLIEEEANFVDVDYDPGKDVTEAIEFSLTGGVDSGEIPEAQPGGESESLPK